MAQTPAYPPGRRATWWAIRPAGRGHFGAQDRGADLSDSWPDDVRGKRGRGAGGKIAADYVEGQLNDGYTLFLCSHADAINTVLYKKQALTIEDFSAVSMVTKFYYVITVASADAGE
ncbi:MAG: hypothetical protein JWN73_3541 [Betaproteobacteria bacterium]|nr:hypothetical protein [Betaproteobacteria bacterium]